MDLKFQTADRADFADGFIIYYFLFVICYLSSPSPPAARDHS